MGDATSYTFFVSTGRCGTTSLTQYFSKMGDKHFKATGELVQAHHERPGPYSFLQRDQRARETSVAERLLRTPAHYIETSHGFAKWGYQDWLFPAISGKLNVVSLVRHPSEVAQSLAHRGTRVAGDSPWHLNPREATHFPYWDEAWDPVQQFMWEWFEVQARGLDIRDTIVPLGHHWHRIRFRQLARDTKTLARKLGLLYPHVSLPKLNVNGIKTPRENREELLKSFLDTLSPSGMKTAGNILDQLEISA